MTGKKPIIKLTNIFLYLAVLYYLLPFSPVNLYLFTHKQSTASFCQAGNKTSDAFSYHKLQVKSTASFINKDKNRFDVEAILSITPALQKISFSFASCSSHYLIFHSDPLIYYNSNRGPPALRSFSYTQS